VHDGAASVCSQIGLGWFFLLFHFEVGIDPTEDESLIALLAHRFEVVVSKPCIVAVVVLYPYAVYGSKLFKCLLSINCFQQGEIACYDTNKLEPGTMVNKDQGVLVAVHSKLPFAWRKKPGSIDWR
jgi:hypothetical protein